MIGNTLGYLYLNFYNLIYSTYSVNVSDFHKIVQSSQALNQANLHDWLKAGDEYLDTTHQDAGAFFFFFCKSCYTIRQSNLPSIRNTTANIRGNFFQD